MDGGEAQVVKRATPPPGALAESARWLQPVAGPASIPEEEGGNASSSVHSPTARSLRRLTPPPGDLGRAVCAMTPGKSSSRLKDALVEEDREHEDTVSELPGSDAESSMRSLRESASQLALDDKHADRGILKHLPTPASGALAEQARASAGQEHPGAIEEGCKEEASQDA